MLKTLQDFFKDFLIFLMLGCFLFEVFVLEGVVIEGVSFDGIGFVPLDFEVHGLLVPFFNSVRDCVHGIYPSHEGGRNSP